MQLRHRLLNQIRTVHLNCNNFDPFVSIEKWICRTYTKFNIMVSLNSIGLINGNKSTMALVPVLFTDLMIL